jgi:aryl-alcohol dehydrogenase-like predicted oxidoreductase
VQLHCPPTEVYYRPEIFGVFEDMIAEGKIKKLGVSVEKVEEGLKAMEYDLVSSVQIIFNIFRQRPSELFFQQAKKNNVGIIARVPLASGLLTGKFTRDTTFGKDDHRNFNRNGEMFDKGETFSGIDYNKGLEIVDKLKSLFPDTELPVLALKWILMFEAVSCVIPGASSPAQILANINAANTTSLSTAQMETLSRVYQEEVKPFVHQLW